MSKPRNLGERSRILADALLAVPRTTYQQRSLSALLGLFLDLGTKTALHRAELVSASALSRFLNRYDWDTARCWSLLVRAQWDALLLAARSKRQPRLRLCVDLTSIPKTGRTLPFVRVYHEVHGIHLVVLYAVFGDLKFPVGYRVYRGKGTTSPVRLALELLQSVPEEVKRRFDGWVLADSGFESADFLQGVRELGFEFVVGVRENRRTDHPDLPSVRDHAHGAWLSLANWSEDTVTLARTQRAERTFFAVASQLMDGDEVAGEGARRWQIESFFKEGKHQFGLAQFALHSELGFDRWLLLVFAAFTLTVLHATEQLSLEEAASLALTVALPFVRLARFIRRLHHEQDFLRQHGFQATLSRCNI